MTRRAFPDISRTPWRCQPRVRASPSRIDTETLHLGSAIQRQKHSSTIKRHQTPEITSTVVIFIDPYQPPNFISGTFVCAWIRMPAVLEAYKSYPTTFEKTVDFMKIFTFWYHKQPIPRYSFFITHRQTQRMHFWIACDLTLPGKSFRSQTNSPILRNLKFPTWLLTLSTRPFRLVLRLHKPFCPGEYDIIWCAR